jgi:aspartate kinase
MRYQLDAGKVVVVAGFQGINAEGDITTLGRGGSDTTAVALAAALNADECQIYTDVDGVYTTDPRVEPKAKRLDKITYDEMLELASLGAKVLQIRSVEFASKYNVPLRVLSSLKEGGGTLITSEEHFKENEMEQPLISGIAFSRDEAKLMILGVPDKPGIAYQIIGPIADLNIDIDMIIQNQGIEGTTDFTFTVGRLDAAAALEVLQSTANKLGAREVLSDDTIVKLSMVGVGMKSHAGIASTVFKTLADNDINIQMIGTTEIKISVIIEEAKLELAVQSLHEAFDLDK